MTVIRFCGANNVSVQTTFLWQNTGASGRVMLARHLRLRRSQDFRTVRKLGRHYRSNLLILNVLPNTLPHNRFGFVVGKSTGQAVTRNRIKRRLRAAAAALVSDLQPGHDIVIVARQQAADATYGELLAYMQEVLAQAHLYQHST